MKTKCHSDFIGAETAELNTALIMMKQVVVRVWYSKVHRLTDRSERVGEKSKGAYVLRSVYFEPVLVGGELCSLNGVYDGS